MGKLSVQDNAVLDIIEARKTAGAKGNSNDDLAHGPNDWVAFITAYLGRAARGVHRNEKEGQQYRDNLVKAGGLILSAIVAYDRNDRAMPVKPGTVEVLVKE